MSGDTAAAVARLLQDDGQCPAQDPVVLWAEYERTQVIGLPVGGAYAGGAHRHVPPRPPTPVCPQEENPNDA